MDPGAIAADGHDAPAATASAVSRARTSTTTTHGGLVAAAAIAALAVLETVQALVAPSLAPTDGDWKTAARQVRGEFRRGDLIVAAPAWADPILRMHLGDLLPVAVLARMDDARYGRVWEISQRGARGVSEGGGPFAGRVAETIRCGALTVRRIDRRPAAVTFDALERWQEALVTRRGGEGSGGASVPVDVCPWRGDRFVCPGVGNTVHRELVEVDTRIRMALLAPPVPRAVTGVEFPAVPLGRELVVAAGLHDVWARKYATGTVHLEIWIAGARVGQTDIGNRSGWQLQHIDTSARAGQTMPVRFEISSPRPELRHFAFAAEARR